METKIRVGLIVVHTFLSIIVFAQNDKTLEFERQEKIVVDSIKKAMKQNSYEPVQNLFDSKTITNSDALSLIYRYKAHFLNDQLNNLHPIEDSVKFYNTLNEILQNFNSSIEMSECIHKTENQHYKYEFLEDLTIKHGDKLRDTFKTEFDKLESELIKKGLKGDRYGFGLGVHYIHGHNNWVGVNFSVFSQFDPFEYFEEICDDELWYLRPDGFLTFGFNAVSFIYDKAIDSEKSTLSFTVMDMYSPMYLNPLRFGVEFDPEFGPRGFYRPGIGIGYGWFSVSYAYNFMFSKQRWDNDERHMLYFKLNFVINDHWE